jgi:hypothetical protein
MELPNVCGFTFETDCTEDIQHDYALFIADGLEYPEARAELIRRGAKMPINCKHIGHHYSYELES